MYCLLPKISEKEIVIQSLLLHFLFIREIYIAWEILLLFSFVPFDVNDLLVGFENLEKFWMQKMYGYFYVL